MQTALDYLEDNMMDFEMLGVTANTDAMRAAVEGLLIGFADYHVRRALESASKAARIEQGDGSKCVAFSTNFIPESGSISASIDKHSITNAYPKSKYIL